MVRLLNGTEEERFTLDDPIPEYYQWVRDMCNGEDGPNTYTYDYGITP